MGKNCSQKLEGNEKSMKQPVLNTNITTEAYLRANKKSAVDYIDSLVTFFKKIFCNDKQAG